MAKKKLSIPEQIEHEEKYVKFLLKMLESANYKKFASPEEFQKTKLKYDKAKFKLKCLKMGK